MSNISDDDYNYIKNNWERLSEVEMFLTGFISNEERRYAESIATSYVSQQSGMSIEEAEKIFKGLRPERSMWGGKYAKQYKEVCLNYVASRLEKYRSEIYKVVCADFDYCNKRKLKKFLSEEYQLGIAIAEALLVATTQLPFPIATTTIYLVKHKILDKWCNCNKSGE